MGIIDALLRMTANPILRIIDFDRPDYNAADREKSPKMIYSLTMQRPFHVENRKFAFSYNFPKSGSIAKARARHGFFCDGAAADFKECEDNVL